MPPAQPMPEPQNNARDNEAPKPKLYTEVEKGKILTREQIQELMFSMYDDTTPPTISDETKNSIQENALDATDNIPPNTPERAIFERCLLTYLDMSIDFSNPYWPDNLFVQIMEETKQKAKWNHEFHRVHSLGEISLIVENYIDYGGYEGNEPPYIDEKEAQYYKDALDFFALLGIEEGKKLSPEELVRFKKLKAAIKAMNKVDQ